MEELGRNTRSSFNQPKVFMFSLDSSEFTHNNKPKEIDSLEVSTSMNLVFGGTNQGHVLVWKVSLSDNYSLKLVSMI